MKHPAFRLSLVLLACLASSGAFAQQVIRIATVAPEGSAWMRELRAAAAQVKAGTADRVQLKFYPGGVMGSEDAVLRKVRSGQLQGGVLTASSLSAVDADVNAYTLPFLFHDWKQVDRARPQMDALLTRRLEAKGIRMLTSSSIGFAYLMSTSPLRTLSDMRTHRMWIPPNDQVAALTMDAAGASAIPLPLGDVFTGLQTGLVDTITNTPSATIALQWHGRLKYLVDVPVVFVVGYTVIDQKAWKGLSPADQSVLANAVTSAARRTEAQSRKDDAGALAALARQGVQIIRLDAAETARWRDVGVRVQRRMVQDKAFSPEAMAILDRATSTSAPVAKAGSR